MKNYKGLSENEVTESRRINGKNVLTPPAKTPWYILLAEKFKDPIIVILIFAAIISLVVGIMEGSYVEPIGIIIAIGLATGIGFYMEYSAKKKFDILNQISDTEPVKVFRNGKVTEIPKDDLVVGDYVILSTGDEIPADCDLIEAIDLKVDESTMTGESVAVGKCEKDKNNEWKESGFAPWQVLRSTKITSGSGVGIVTSVGDKTEIGKTTRQAMEETDIETPLNKQLNGLAKLINKAAFTMAALLLVFLNIHHFGFTEEPDMSWMGIFMTEIKFIMQAVVLIVVSVPEGLPLASTLSLAFSMKTMAKENNLVKKMHACETIGAVNIIFSDKTGTLTQNKMTVVDTEILESKKAILNMAVNSTANLDGSKIIGNPTEGAMISKLASDGYNYVDLRDEFQVIDQKPFSSMDKYMMTKIEYDGSDLYLVKGAPEVIAKMIIGDSEFLKNVESQQARGRRAISLASGPDMEHLEYNGSVFIEDPVRPDVPDAVEKCYKAGIDVIMMTGDNIKTGTEIARQAGFSRKLQGESESDVWAIEAKDWDKYAWSVNSGMGYPNVIARCKPEDKLHILKQMQAKGKVCAMCGDGRFMPLHYCEVVYESL